MNLRKSKAYKVAAMSKSILQRISDLEHKVFEQNTLFIEFRFCLKGREIRTGIVNENTITQQFDILKARYSSKKNCGDFVVLLTEKITQNTLDKFYITARSFTKISGFIPDPKEYFEFEKAIQEYERSIKCAS